MSPKLLSCIFLAIIAMDCVQASASNNTLQQFVRSRRSNEDCGKCGQSKGQSATPMIISGEVVRPVNKYPWVVALTTKEDPSPFCGGSIITEKFILTAAHCLRRKDATITEDLDDGKCKTDQGQGNCLMEPDEIEVRFLDDTKGAVEELYSSPEYKAATPYKEDMGLIRLKEPIKCDEFKSFVCLPEGEHIAKQDTGSRMIITGWGIMNSDTMKNSEDLREIQVTVEDSDDCEEHGWTPEHDNRAYCVSSKGVGSPCFGDSGGNLFAYRDGKNIVFGVATVVYSPVCSNDIPSLFTAVAPFMEWIRTIINK